MLVEGNTAVLQRLERHPSTLPAADAAQALFPDGVPDACGLAAAKGLGEQQRGAALAGATRWKVRSDGAITLQAVLALLVVFSSAAADKAIVCRSVGAGGSDTPAHCRVFSSFDNGAKRCDACKFVERRLQQATSARRIAGASALPASAPVHLPHFVTALRDGAGAFCAQYDEGLANGFSPMLAALALRPRLCAFIEGQLVGVKYLIVGEDGRARISPSIRWPEHVLEPFLLMFTQVMTAASALAALTARAPATGQVASLLLFQPHVHCADAGDNAGPQQL